jgi:hypothetical protein
MSKARQELHRALYPRQKYKNRKVVVGGVTYDSKLEHKNCYELKIREGQGEITELKMKPKFQLFDSFKDSSGKTEIGAKYTPEASYVENGQKYVYEVKSAFTAKETAYILRRKLFKLKYPDYIFLEVQ